MIDSAESPSLLRVALAQTGDAFSTNAENIGALRALVDGDSEATDLLLAPELLNTGYLPVEFAARCEHEGGESETALGTLAAERECAIVAGLGVRRGDTLTNEAVVFAPDVIARYRKRRLFVSNVIDESDYFLAGVEPVVADVAGTRVGLAVCFDLRFPEVFRPYFHDEVPVIAIISAFPEARAEHWRTLVRARAIENQCFVVACNRAGRDGDLVFAGRSAVVDPWGEVLVEAGGPDDVGLFRADLDLRECVKARRRIPCLRAAKKD